MYFLVREERSIAIMYMKQINQLSTLDHLAFPFIDNSIINPTLIRC